MPLGERKDRRQGTAGTFGQLDVTYPSGDLSFPRLNLRRGGRATEGPKKFLSPGPDENRFPGAKLVAQHLETSDTVNVTVAETWETIPGPWIYSMEFDAALGPTTTRRRTVLFDSAQVGTSTAERETRFEPIEGLAILAQEIEKTWTLPGPLFTSQSFSSTGDLVTTTKRRIAAPHTPTLTTLASGLTSIKVTKPGTYTSAPGITFTGGGGAGGAATATIGALGVVGVTLTAPGADYTAVPAVTFIGGGGAGGAAATAVLGKKGVKGVTLTAPGSGFTSAPAVRFRSGVGTGAAATAVLAGAGIDFIAPVLFGSNYTSAPLLTFSGGGGTGAAAFCDLTWPGVESVTITDPGSGYITRPIVAFATATGSGAVAFADFSTGIASIAVTAPGSGYERSYLDCHIDPPDLPGGVQATAFGVVDSSGHVVSVTVAVPGSGYSFPPVVRLTDFRGSGATATAALAPVGISSIKVTNRGVYTSAPAITIAPPASGVTATASAVLGKQVAYYTVTAPGTGYTSPPTVNYTGGGGGSGASAQVTLLPRAVASVLMTAPGTNYTSPPVVTILGGGGTGADGTAVLGQPLTGIVVTAPGAYTSVPTVGIAGDGAGASGTAILGAGITAINITNPGSGYTGTPKVVIAGTGGGHATARVGVSSTVERTQAIDSVTLELETTLRGIGTIRYRQKKADNQVPGSRATVREYLVLANSTMPPDGDFTEYEREDFGVDPNLKIEIETTYEIPDNFLEVRENAFTFPRLLHSWVSFSPVGTTVDARAGFSEVVPHYITHWFTVGPVSFADGTGLEVDRIIEADCTVFSEQVRGLIDPGIFMTKTISGVTYTSAVLSDSIPTRPDYIDNWIGTLRNVGGNSDVWRAGIYHNTLIQVRMI